MSDIEMISSVIDVVFSVVGKYRSQF